jgi:transposase-like protein
MNFQDILAVANDESKAIELFEKLRWPNGPVCPHCTSSSDKPVRVYALKGVKDKKGRERFGLWKCGNCRKQFTARVGTIFEDSHVPIGKWLHCIYEMCSAKKGVSAAQLQRKLGVNYRTSWYMCHRVRLAMEQEPLASKLGRDGGIVEIDETFIGGKVGNNLHRNKTKAAGKKVAVLTLVDRDGDARTFPVPNTKKVTLQAIARPNIDGAANIVTDENLAYDGIGDHFKSHHTVDHSKTFVRPVILHTNFAESYHSLLKRGIVGAFHHVSEHHLPRYLREFEFRWNRRKATDGERFAEAIRGAGGKRLLYRTPKSDRH